jgi:DNA-binding GntR family transcriptional regulator
MIRLQARFSSHQVGRKSAVLSGRCIKHPCGTLTKTNHVVVLGSCKVMESRQLSSLEHENLSDTVYATLCEAIVSGRFHSGDRLKIRDMAKQLGTSVTPVRDAILRLAHDDAVVFKSARDIRIPAITRDRYLEIRAIRLRLEALAAETAAALATQADIDGLKEILRQNEIAIDRQDRRRGTALNQAFHFQLSVIARMPFLHSTLSRIWLQMGPLIADTYLDGKRSMIDHHYPIVDALERHDGAAAAASITSDITLGGKVLMDRFSGEGTGARKLAPARKPFSKIVSS